MTQNLTISYESSIFLGFFLSASMFGSLIKAQKMEAVKEGEIFANKRMKVVASLKEQKKMLYSK